MPWGRQSGYHNIRNRGAEEQPSGGFFAWARRQIEVLLKSGGGDPPLATILYTHAIDEELGALVPPAQGRPSPSFHQNPYEGQTR